MNAILNNTENPEPLIKDGIFNTEKVLVDIYPSIEHGNLTAVKSIVLHRTDSSNAKGTLAAYKRGQKTGAHFLIDTDGTIYQTANMEQICWHVGVLLPRCQIEENCDPADLKTITALIHEEGVGFGKRSRNLSRHEEKKSYPLRYPSNKDSLGIEVVGRFLSNEKKFENPTQLQFKSLKWLTDQLIKEFGLHVKTDVFAHGQIARKQASEGGQLLQYLFSETSK